ncbi:MAG: AAA family ATPase [Desulfovibrionaceae bacterium]|nr:AAA family ATPase [Desulfovibrionaceae bacterium]
MFLSRPRRFGKSLLINTLRSLFLEGVEHFKGLSIEKNGTIKYIML